MARKLRYGKGKSSIEITGPQKELFEKALKEVAGTTIKVIEDEVDARVKFAKENWLVRYGKRAEGWYWTNLANTESFLLPATSKRSVDKFTTGIRILKGGRSIEGFFRNNAPYAYVIKAAKYSKTSKGTATRYEEGSLIGEETMWKPVKKNVNKLVKKLADAYMKDQQKKV